MMKPFAEKMILPCAAKAVIFDMDGVLSDSEWIYEKKILQVLAEEGITIKSEEINDLLDRAWSLSAGS